MEDLLLRTLLMIPVLILNGYLAIRMHHRLNVAREMRFLKHLKIIHPDSEIIFSSIATNEYEALKKLKTQLDGQ